MWMQSWDVICEEKRWACLQREEQKQVGNYNAERRHFCNTVQRYCEYKTSKTGAFEKVYNKTLQS